MLHRVLQSETGNAFTKGGGGGVQAGSSSVGTRVKRQIKDVNVLI